jgi:hypothetical protein
MKHTASSYETNVKEEEEKKNTKQKEKDWKINLENQNTEEERTEGRERKEGKYRSGIWLVTAKPICYYALDTHPHLSPSRDNLYQLSKNMTSEAGFTHVSSATFRRLCARYLELLTDSATQQAASTFSSWFSGLVTDVTAPTK